MLTYVLRRILTMIPTLFLVSVLTFIIIQLPPGDLATSQAANAIAQGEVLTEDEVESLRARYGLGDPIYVQYGKWIGGVVQGDFGYSYTWRQPVSTLIDNRLGFTLLLSSVSLLLTWLIALPIGIYSAVRKYSVGDYLATFVGFIGLAIPDFLVALILMYVAYKYFDLSVGGLFSEEYVDAAWSMGKVLDLAGHLWIPALVIAIGSTAGLIRVMRANLLDELPQQYVVTARAKGLSEPRVLLKYPVRMAMNPFVSTIGWSLPAVFSGETIIGVVLSLPTMGPLLLDALRSQDMYLAGSIILILAVLTVIGTLISDLMLAWLDPRIRLG